MPDPNPIVIPVPGEAPKEKPAMDPQDYAMLKLHAHQGIQKAADGVTALLEAGRYDYLEGKDKVSFAESTGVRHVEESGSGRARTTTDGLPANR